MPKTVSPKKSKLQLPHVDEDDRALLREWQQGACPPSRLTLSEWADRYRVLSSESSAEPGQWVTANVPYEKAIMDAISDPFVPRVVVQKGAQLGITDAAILNPIGYFIDQDPCPILVVQPTVELAEAFSTDRLAPMLRDSPHLRAKVADPRARDSQNTLRRKGFKGGYVAIGGANSAASLSGRPVRVVLLDDVDRYPSSAGTEGNPLQLAIARTSGFWNRKVVIISSPGTRGVSHIEREMLQSTCEHWYLPCPECGAMQVLMFERIDFDDLTHSCVECPARSLKFRWLQGRGEFRAHRPFDDHGRKVTTRGFYVSGLYNPWLEWDVLRDEFVLAARANEEGDVEPLKAFNNTRLGKLHEEQGSKVQIDLYDTRREEFAAEVPQGVLVITAGADVQDQSLHCDVIGWGAGFENWHLDYLTIPGDPRTDEPWEALDEAVFNRVFTTFDGKKMRVRRMCIDSSFASDYVYAYTKARQPRCIAIKGMGGLGKPAICALTFSKSNRCLIASIGVDTLKEEIMNRLNVSVVGAGFCHYPKSDFEGEPINGYDVDYFEGLRAESRITKSKYGFKTYVWTKRVSQRNESWDCFVYALAATRLPHSGIKLATTARNGVKLETMTRDVLFESQTNESKQSAKFGAQSMATDLVEKPKQAAPVNKTQFGAMNRPIY
jgi:phage terminase large subunit GpA-like protein